MAMHKYNTASPRIGALKGTFLKHAVPQETLNIVGNQHNIDKNMSDTVIFRRFLPTGGATTNSTTINRWSITTQDHLTSEGVTPEAETITPQDITVTLDQYSCLYSYTDVTAELYEDKIPDEMKVLTGERMGLLRELISYGALKAGTNKFYAGGTSRATVDETISLNLLRKITRSLQNNRCKKITSTIKSSANYGTAQVEPGYLVFHHVDMSHDIRELEGFTKRVEYGDSRSAVHPMEIGAVDEFRFICSPEFSPVVNSGASVGSTGLVSTGGSTIDVYPTMVVGHDAWGNVALRGMKSFDSIHLPTTPDKADPIGQRGYVGAKFYNAAFIQNDGWMAVLESGATDL